MIEEYYNLNVVVKDQTHFFFSVDPDLQDGDQNSSSEIASLPARPILLLREWKRSYEQCQ
jgi:hypothetical protein